MIGKLLGYTPVQTTTRYANLAHAPVLSSANRIADNIASNLFRSKVTMTKSQAEDAAGVQADSGYRAPFCKKQLVSK